MTLSTASKLAKTADFCQKRRAGTVRQHRPALTTNRNGAATMAKPIPTPIPEDVKARFWAKVDVRGPDECWPWIAGTHGTSDPRGRFWYGTKNVDAARWLYQQMHPSAFMDGLVVMHRCDNPLCVNPDHLRLGTYADNMADMHAKGRAHQQTDPSVGQRAMAAGNATMAAEPHRRCQGERHPSARLTVADVVAIRASNISSVKLAREYGVSPSTIQCVKNGTKWKSVGRATAIRNPKDQPHAGKEQSDA
jgi:hypothetical protein